MKYYSTIEELKKLAGEIPPETCPEIDKVIRQLRDASSNCKDIEKLVNKSHPEEAESVYKDCEDLAYYIRRYDLEDIEMKLEDLRDTNERLRYLGEFWYSESKNYYRILQEYEIEITAYRNTIEYKIKEFINKLRVSFRKKVLRKVISKPIYTI